MDDRQLRDELLPKLLELHAAPLDPNLLAAYVDDALTDEERASVEARLASDPEAQWLVRSLRADRERAQAAPWRMVAIAAAVLLAVGLWWVGRDDEPARSSLPDRLATVTAELASRSPELFGDFALLAGDELRTRPAATRGGTRWLAPLGVVVEPPQVLRWQPAPGATRVEVTITGGDVRWSQELEGDEAPAPALPPGRYVVRVRSLDALGGQEVRRGFQVAAPDAQARHARALARILEVAGEDLAPLVAAHYAVRHDLLEKARAFAGAAAHRDDEVGKAAQALLRHVVALTGDE